MPEKRGHLSTSFAIALSLSATDVFADTYIVKSALEAKDAIARALPGDQIVVKAGTYRDFGVLIPFGKNGTANKPIVLRAEAPGKVKLRRDSHFDVRGSHWNIHGFEFVETRARSIKISYASHIRVSHVSLLRPGCASWTATGACVPPSGPVDAIFVGNNSSNILVENSRIINPFGLGVVVGQLRPQQEGAPGQYGTTLTNPSDIIIRSNRFEAFDKHFPNGGEAIMVGYVYEGKLNDNVRAVIEKNVFFSINSDDETIGLKSSENIVRGNIFYNCDGHISVRFGNRNRIENNRATGLVHGVRISGSANIVRNNRIALRPGGAAITLVEGQVAGGATTYLPATDNVIEGNQFINAATGVRVQNGSASQSGSIRRNSIQGNFFSAQPGSFRWISAPLDLMPQLMRDNVLQTAP